MHPVTTIGCAAAQYVVSGSIGPLVSAANASVAVIAGYDALWPERHTAIAWPEVRGGNCSPVASTYLWQKYAILELTSTNPPLLGVYSHTTGRGLPAAGKSAHAASASVGGLGVGRSRDPTGPHATSSNAETATQSILAISNAGILRQVGQPGPLIREASAEPRSTSSGSPAAHACADRPSAPTSPASSPPDSPRPPSGWHR